MTSFLSFVLMVFFFYLLARGGAGGTGQAEGKNSAIKESYSALSASTSALLDDDI